jgi:outer membrane protein assembly factor BamB
LNDGNVKSALLFVCTVVFSSGKIFGSDWPQLLGPTRNAVYAGPALSENWTDNSRVVWQRDVGEGYSSPVISEGRLVICHRLSTNLVVECLDAKDAKPQWKFTHGMKFQDGAYFDSGPRPTPSIQGDKVFVHNTDGYLVCLDFKTGEKIWSHHIRSEFKSSATWHGCVASPLVTEKALILPAGGTNGAGIVALAPDTGKILWQVTDDKASASSPVLATFGGVPQVLVVTRSTFHSINPDNGEDFWSLPTGRQSSGNVYAASPIVFGDSIFLSGWYKLGAQLLRVSDRKPTVVWQSDDAVSTHYANAIIHKGYIYGFHGHAWENNGPNLRCAELATGKMVWEQPQQGSGTIVRCSNNLLILFDSGELQLAEANPKSFKVKTRLQVVGRTTRSYPALADGFAYIKGPKKLVCVDLR